MHSQRRVTAFAALSPLRSLPQQPQASKVLDAERILRAVVVHCGDSALLEKLERSGEISSEAGQLGSGALTLRDLAALEGRGLRTQVLRGVGRKDELFLADPRAERRARRTWRSAGPRTELVRDRSERR